MVNLTSFTLDHRTIHRRFLMTYPHGSLLRCLTNRQIDNLQGRIIMRKQFPFLDDFENDSAE